MRKSGSWENLKTFVPGATGMGETTVEEIAVDPAAPKAFYRVITE